ncbi:hypothetical protein GCM10008905_08370 [Clostridium malenominatum]|uniref:Uncharacterized protein n=1 Tax=Clostridium malenominatum TaxID=1539 RepID=A0ABN1IRA4_9CLOT
MSKKVSISLPDHVYTLAKKKSKFTHGDNFSGYIRDLICKQFTEEELKNELKPLWTGRKQLAKLDTICEYCKRQIIAANTVIYQTDLGFTEEWKNWVHEECCRKE